jgi:NAD(P)-dependent dehydrogenase (short-subunit alcohol dehydrogenase family)
MAKRKGGMGRVAGKVALVAGAGGGIGGAGAEALAREEAAVFCTDSDGAAAEATAARIRRAGGRATAAALDVRDRVAVDAAVAAVAREFGRLDVVLESAGIAHRLDFLDVDAETWDRVIAVNLTGMFHVGQAAARQMVKQGGGGSIINVTSQLAEVARPERAAYVASSALADACDGRRSCGARHPRQCDCAWPDADRAHARKLHRPRSSACDRGVDPARAARPARRSGAVLFLASDESRWVTGSTVTVDGGYLAI